MTWPEAEELLGPDTVALLPVGATEPHGPHLPLDTDVTIAVSQARHAAELFAGDGVRAVVLPPLAYGLTHFTKGFSGRVTLRPGTLWALLEDVVQSLEDLGVRRVMFCNAHLEPAHVKILRGVAADCAERTPSRAQVVFPDNTRRRWAGTLGEEFASGDCHAGRYETSIVMHADPSGVREEQRTALPEHWVHLIEKMRAGAVSFAEAGADRAYCGDPAAASEAEGRELVERLAEMTVACAREAWPDLFEGGGT
jgi:creatinine amidohydrolase